MNKFSFVLASFCLVMGLRLPAQTGTELSRVETAVRDFVRLGDLQQAEGLNQVLHPDFRAVVNRAMGSPEVSLLDKTSYLQLIRDQKIGGDTREVHLLYVDIVNHNATVKAVLEGKTLRFVTFVSLIRIPDGTWQVVGDMPDISLR